MGRTGYTGLHTDAYRRPHRSRQDGRLAGDPAHSLRAIQRGKSAGGHPHALRRDALDLRNVPANGITCQNFTILWFNVDHMAMYVRRDGPQMR